MSHVVEKKNYTTHRNRITVSVGFCTNLSNSTRVK